jgi:hypothetical protein
MQRSSAFRPDMSILKTPLNQNNVLRRLQLDLGAVLPGFAAAKAPDPWTLLEALRKLNSPALILLDTYEKVTESKELVDWIETQLLAEVEHCEQLRFLIGGQKVPSAPPVGVTLRKK